MHLINRDDTNNVTNPVYSANLEPTKKDDTDYEHIYDYINETEEHKVELKDMACTL